MSQPEQQALQKLRQSGKILRETREEIKRFVREGIPIIDVCEKAEELIRIKGASQRSPATYQSTK